MGWKEVRVGTRESTVAVIPSMAHLPSEALASSSVFETVSGSPFLPHKAPGHQAMKQTGKLGQIMNCSHHTEK